MLLSVSPCSKHRITCPRGTCNPFPLESIHSPCVCPNPWYFDSKGIDSVARNCVEIHGLRKRKPSREFAARRLRIPFLLHPMAGSRTNFQNKPLLPFDLCHLNFELLLGFSNRSNGPAGAGAKRKIQTWRWLDAPTHEAVHQYRKDDERNHHVKPVTLHGESSNREGNARHRSCDQKQQPELDQASSSKG